MPKKDKNKDLDIEAIIRTAVEAGRMAEAKGSKDIQRSTENRLYAYPVLQQRILDNQERLEEFKTHGPRGRSAGIVRYQKSGSRLSPEEIYEFVLKDMEAAIAADEDEVSTIDRAISLIQNDPFIRAVTGKYFDGLSDDGIGEEIHCDATTVWRNRKRLLKTIQTYLYGAMAVC